MQCPSCRAVYSNGLSLCPRCQTPAIVTSSPETQAALPETQPAEEAATQAEEVEAVPMAMADEELAHEPTQAAPPVSTLLEFPGVSRNKPQWRKELSERVREIQERRAREAAEATVETTMPPSPAPQLGLVPQPDAPVVNPIVAAALKRLERARQQNPVTRTRMGGGGAATAVARVAEEQYQPTENQDLELGALDLPVSETEQLAEEKPVEVARERTLVVVPPAPQVKAPVEQSEVVAQPASKKVFVEKILGDLDCVDEAIPDIIPATEPYDDRAPIISRVVGSFIDLLVVAFASSPFAAIIELTNGNWSDIRVLASMGGIIVTIMFLYLAASTALAGRTWGMSVLSLRIADAESGLPPTTKQAVGRTLLYMISLALFGLGILYALFDAEGRTAHDCFSGTVAVRE